MLYRKIKSYYDEKSEAGIENIRMKLTEDFNSGALLCDSDYFRFLFNIGQRNSLRDGKMNYISLITINCKNTNKQSNEEMKKRIKALCKRQYKRYQKRAYFGYHFGTYFSRPFSMVFRFSMRQLGPSSVNISH